MFVCLFIASIYLKYNQQDATSSQSIYFYKLLYMFQAVPPPIIRSTKLYLQRQVLSNQYCCLLLSWMRWNCVSGGSSAHHQEHKTVHTASGIVKPILLPAAIVDEMKLRFRRFLRPSSGAQNCTYSVMYCQTNTAACCYRG